MLVDHVTITFPHADGLARDQFVNTFTYFSETDIDGAGMGAIEAAIAQFLTATPADGTAVGAPGILLGPQVARTPHPVFRHYDADGHLAGTSPLGSPVRITTMDTALPAPVSGFPMPSEVSIALSFHAAFGSDVEFGSHTRPRARDRGRIFFGPLVGSALIVATEGTSNRPNVAHNTRTALLSNALTYLQSPTSAIQHAVWSRKNGTIKAVTGYSCDDAFDTQRRRGERPIVRQAVGL